LITITATDYAFGVPDTIPAGLTTFRLVNQGRELHHANLVRLGEGKTVADFQAGLAAAMKHHTPPPTWMGFAGGPNAVTLGDTGVATQTLEPGSYVFVCWIPSLDGVPHVMKGMLHPLLVTPGAAAPAAAEPGVTSSGCSMPFITCGTPSRLGIQHTNTYDPGSSVWVATPVSPRVTALGPPANPIQVGGGVWCFIAAASPA